MKKIILGLIGFILLFIINIMVFWFKNTSSEIQVKDTPLTGNEKQAYFAGGCFWCMEGIFEGQEGVIEARTGYIGGTPDTANYSDVSTGTTKHREGVEVFYNPEKISYAKLVELFWTQIDPTDAEGQFADKGYQYTTAIYYSDAVEKEIAEKSKDTLEESAKFESEIATLILPTTEFYEAEAYHQDYYKNAATRYNQYAAGSGRKWFIEENWKDRITELSGNTYTEEELRARLTPLQYKVTQEDATEKPFTNEYWDNHEDGIYVDIVDGTPLFSSLDKFESGTGWPSFTKPIDDAFIDEQTDTKFFMTRTEVRSAGSDSHLGHLFDDGPKDKWGLRYCLNSAALKFIPVDELEEEGYGEYMKLF